MRTLTGAMPTTMGKYKLSQDPELAVFTQVLWVQWCWCMLLGLVSAVAQLPMHFLSRVENLASTCPNSFGSTILKHQMNRVTTSALEVLTMGWLRLVGSIKI